jgi:hypothetical protein
MAAKHTIVGEGCAGDEYSMVGSVKDGKGCGVESGLDLGMGIGGD